MWWRHPVQGYQEFVFTSLWEHQGIRYSWEIDVHVILDKCSETCMNYNNHMSAAKLIFLLCCKEPTTTYKTDLFDKMNQFCNLFQFFLSPPVINITTVDYEVRKGLTLPYHSWFIKAGAELLWDVFIIAFCWGRISFTCWLCEFLFHYFFSLWGYLSSLWFSCEVVIIWVQPLVHIDIVFMFDCLPVSWSSC